jgi:hypothetical protein
MQTSARILRHFLIDFVEQIRTLADSSIGQRGFEWLARRDGPEPELIFLDDRAFSVALHRATEAYRRVRDL